MRKAAGLGIVIAVALGAHQPAGAEEQQEAYTVGGLGDLPAEMLLCDDDPRNPTGENVGAVCFPVTPGRIITVTVSDDIIHPVGYFWVFSDEHGNFTFGRDGSDPVGELLDSCTVCGDQCEGPFTTVVPPDAVELLVAPHGPVLESVLCDASGMGTTGLVTLTVG